MPSVPFLPTRIYVDPAVEAMPLTRRVLLSLPQVPVERVESAEIVKKPLPMTEAKKSLFITKSHGSALKSCQGGGDYVCCDYFTLSFVSNCHFECTYCILQDYLRNNPVISVFANVDEILGEASARLRQSPERMFRIGTGELADSLGLDPITGVSADLVRFTADHPNMILELKTKSTFIENLEGLDHRGRVVVAWSVNPQAFIDLEEHKTAPLIDRLQAARRAADWGYKVAFHLDPLLHFDGWQGHYRDLVGLLEENFKPGEIAWISLGSLRYTKGLAKVIRERWPKSQLLYGELFPSEDGKIRYFRQIREELSRSVKSYVDKAFPGVPNYLCMETGQVWEKVFQFIPESPKEMESGLLERFSC